MSLCSPKGLSLWDLVIRHLWRFAATSLQQNAIKSTGKPQSEKLQMKEGL